MNSRERVTAALRLKRPDRVPVIEFVIDEKVARAATPEARDVAGGMDRLEMDCVGSNNRPIGEPTTMGVAAQAAVWTWISGLLLGAAPAMSAERSYAFYQPQVEHVVIHEGRLAPGHYAYNHMASVEWFDGRFHAVWGGNAATHLEGKPPQFNLWATSSDFRRWSPPRRLAHDGPGGLAEDLEGVQWQPNLLNFHDRQLWCVWSFNSRQAELDGLYLSVLEKGSDQWRHRRLQRRQMVDGKSCSIFASQNPVLLESGRVLAPVTLNFRDPKHDAGAGHAPGSLVRRWNACFYSDDGGATWRCSNPISSIDDAEGQWEPFFYQQADGRLRALMRNFTKGTPPAAQWRLTTVGRGGAPGTPVEFPDDPVFSFQETVNCRPQVFRLPGGRYCLLQQDAVTNHRDYQTRLNVALHFSRTGGDDFVAGPPVSRPGVISAYPQGVAHGGRLYLAYTTGPGDGPRSIEGAIVTPAPDPAPFYVWPRAKELIVMQESRDAAGKKKVARANPDARTARPRLTTIHGRQALAFSGRASAGVDLEAIDFAAGQSLEVRFDAHVLRQQPIGMLVLCSLGDRIPIRLGVPSNRPERLYAYCRDQWRPVGEFPQGAWHRVRLTIRGEAFDVALGEQPPRTFPNPLVNPAAKLYLGNGYEVDYLGANAGSEFLVDLGSLRTRVDRPLPKPGP